MGKKARLKKERKRAKSIDEDAPVETTVDKVVRAILLEYASIQLIKQYLSEGTDIDAQAGIGVSMLHVASGKGNLELVRFLLEQGADPNRRGVGGSGALDLAVESDNPDVVRTLLEAGALLDGKNEDGLTAMQKAVKFGRVKAVVALGDAGADYMTYPSGVFDSFSLLHAAAVNDHPEVVKALVKMGADTEAGMEEMPPLALAVQTSSTETVRALLSCGADFDAINGNGHTALNDALHSLHLGAVNALLEAGANLEQADGVENSPLRIAVESGYLESIRSLLDAGAKIDAVEATGNITALKWAARLAAPEIVQLLLERGADAGLDGGDGKTPMHMVSASPTSYGFSGLKELHKRHGEYDKIRAARKMVRRTAHNKPKETVRALVKAGAEVDRLDQDGKTPLFRVASIGDDTLSKMAMLERMMGRNSISEDMVTGFDTARHQIRKVVEAYVENGADIEHRCGEENQTPLNRAAQSSVVEAVKALVKAGADIEAKNSTGRTPLHEAAAAGESESIRFLVKAGADDMARTPEGATPTELAAEAGRDDAVEVLRKLASARG